MKKREIMPLALGAGVSGAVPRIGGTRFGGGRPPGAGRIGAADPGPRRRGRVPRPISHRWGGAGFGRGVGHGRPLGATFAPGIARWMPSVTTQSPGASPVSITR